MSFFELETAERGWGLSPDLSMTMCLWMSTFPQMDCTLCQTSSRPLPTVYGMTRSTSCFRLDEGPPDSPEAMIVNLLGNSLSERHERERMRGPGSGTPSRRQGGSRTGLTSGRAAARRDAMIMLPGGLELALSVHQPSSLPRRSSDSFDLSSSRATPVNSIATPSTAARASGIDSLRGQSAS